MHKSTIFLAIFAFFSITILLESQFKAAPSAPASQLQANSAFFQTSNSKDPEFQDIESQNFQEQASEQKNNDPQISQDSESLNSNQESKEAGFNAEFFKDFLKSSDQEESSQEEVLLSQTQEVESKLIKYFASIDIEDLEISLDQNQSLIFDTVDLSKEDFQSFNNYKYTKQNSLIAKGTEITFEDSQKADYFYTLLQAVIKSFEGIQINKNNQFQESFYINNPSKPFFVSLVIFDKQKIYCFSYHKDIHESFKGFYEILL